MTNPIERGIFHVASALEVPVLVAALLALALVVVELGGFAVELLSRRRRDVARLVRAADEARAALDRSDPAAARAALRPVGRSSAMTTALGQAVDAVGTQHVEARTAKALADLDLRGEGALARTRLLVRVGPALGLMGTLIPLSPALSGLAAGRISQLTDNLRIAFSVTVLGLLVGAVAFALTLYRDRFYGQDWSDVEYVAAVLTGPAADRDPVAHALPGSDLAVSASEVAAAPAGGSGAPGAPREGSPVERAPTAPITAAPVTAAPATPAGGAAP